MKYSALLLVAAVVAFIFGLGLLFVPAGLLGLYGIVPDAGGLLVARLFGGDLIAIGLAQWVARNFDPAPQRALNPAWLVLNASGFVVALLGVLAGTANSMGWSIVIIHLLLALGYAYYQFMQPVARPVTGRA